MTCEHEDLQAVVGVARIQAEEGGPIAGYTAEVRVWCADCDESFVFHGKGVEVGAIMPDRPTVSIDGLELRVPCRPQSADPSFGLGLMGLTMRVREGTSETSN